MDLLQKLERVEREFPEHLKGALKRMPFIFQGYIGAEMDFREQQRNSVAFAPSSSQKLQTGKGTLYKSFAPKDKNNIYEERSDGFTVGSKLPYATIQEYGGFVESKGKMTSFFWGKFYATGSPYYRNLALSLMKKKREGKKVGVNMKAKPYFAPAEKKFSNEGVNELHNMVLKQIAAIINE